MFQSQLPPGEYFPSPTRVARTRLLIDQEEAELNALENTLAQCQQETQKASSTHCSERIQRIDELNTRTSKLIAELRAAEAKEESEIWDSYRQAEAVTAAAYKEEEDRLQPLVQKLQQKLSKRKGRIAPIKHLPSEMLCEIFKHAVEMGVSPWSLVRVSRAWSTVAFGTPRVWSYICVGVESLYGREPHYESLLGGPYQQCGTEHALKTALDRAGASSLSIRLSLRHDIGYIPLATYFLSQNLTRVEALHLAVSPYAWGDTNTALGDLVIPSMPALHTLSVTDGWRERELFGRIGETVAKESPMLDTLVYKPHGCYAKGFADPVLQRILHADIETLDSVPQAFLESPNLLTLCAKSIQFRSKAGTPMDHVFLGLQELKIDDGYWSLNHAVFPSLTRLSLIESSSSLESPFSLSFPRLQYLHCRQSCWAFLQCFACPVLQTLELLGGPKRLKTVESDIAALWRGDEREMNPKRLVLTVSVRDLRLATALERMDKIEILHLHLVNSSSLGKKLWGRIGPKVAGKGKGKAKDTILPNLKELTLDGVTKVPKGDIGNFVTYATATRKGLIFRDDGLIYDNSVKAMPKPRLKPKQPRIAFSSEEGGEDNDEDDMDEDDI